MSEQMVLTKVLSPKEPIRVRLPDERKSITHKFVIVGGHKDIYIDNDGKIVETFSNINCYLTVGFYDDGNVGEIFVKIGKEGEALSGVYDALAIAISISLQHGVPLKTFIDKFEHTRFEPAGQTKNPNIPLAKSILDYIARWLKRFVPSVESDSSESIDKEQVDGDAGKEEINGVSGSNKEPQ